MNIKKSPVITLKLIKFIHTIIWIIMTMAVFYVFYSGISGNISIYSWFGAGLIVVEGLALLIGKGDCPLHVYALQITGKKHLNDTYLPEMIFFKGNKIVLTTIFLIGLSLMLIK